MAEIGKDIALAKRVLDEGDVVAIPTETVYGLAANALNEKAVMKIFQVKNRPTYDPLIVHIHHLSELNKYVTSVPDTLLALCNLYWPGPLTVLLPKNTCIPDLVTSGLERVAIRIPNQKDTLELLKSLDYPLAAPSANPFGYISPTTAQHVQDQLGDKIKYILDGGPSNIGLESTIVGIEKDRPVVYRLGGLSLDEIQKHLPDCEIRTSSSAPHAPGMLLQHYAPEKKLIIGNIAENILKYKDSKLAILSYREKYSEFRNLILSETGDLNQAASNLFAYLRELDRSDAEVILAEYVPENGLGFAINDRLKRASYKL